MNPRTGICYNMANSGPGGTAANRFVTGWGLGPDGDYGELLPDPFDIARREVDAGRDAPDLLWWQPQGTDGTGYLPNAIARCIETRNWRLLESWQSLVIAYLEAFPGAVSIAHIGRQGKNGVELSRTEMRTFEAFYFAHPRMGMSFDSLGAKDLDPDHESIRWARDLLERGRLVYAEPAARPDMPHMHDLPAMLSSDFLLNQVSTHPKATHRSDLPGYLDYLRETFPAVYVSGIDRREWMPDHAVDHLGRACQAAGVSFAYRANHERWTEDAG